MLSRPSTILFARPNSHFSLLGRTIEPEYVEAVEQALSRLEQRRGRIGCEITVKEIPPSHVGLGSKSSFVLAVLAAIDHVAKLGLNRSEIQKASGRGGTSGIGVNGHFTGGFLVDAGHATDGRHGPSSATIPSGAPPVVFSCPVPSSWRFALLLPQGRRLSGSDERAFFAHNTPIPREESLETISLIYHGLAPAFQQADLATLRGAIRTMQRVGFKHREVEAQTPPVRNLIEFVSDIDSVAGGLSSIGPLVYVVHDVSDAEAIDAIKRYADAENIEYLGDVEASMTGLSINNQ